MAFTASVGGPDSLNGVPCPPRRFHVGRRPDRHHQHRHPRPTGNAAESGDITGIAPGYFVGAALMIIGGIVAAVLGVDAENKSLEDIAEPLTATDARS